MLLCCGQAFIDRIFTVSHERLRACGITPGERRLLAPADLPKLLERLGVAEFKDIGGGTSANSLAVYAALGGKARFVTGIGCDIAGQTFVSDLTRAGVEVRATNIAQHSTGVCYVAISEGGERSMFMSLGAAAHLDFLPTEFDGCSGGDWLFADAYSLFSSSQRLVERLIDTAKNRGLSVAFSLSDPGVVRAKRAEITALLEGIDLLIGNEDEFVGLGNIDNLVNNTRRVISRGDKGLTLIAAGVDANAGIFVPACSVSVVDTTGAGDALAGALLYGESLGLSSLLAACAAARVAAAVVTVPGARLSAESIRAAWAGE